MTKKFTRLALRRHIAPNSAEGASKAHRRRRKRAKKVPKSVRARATTSNRPRPVNPQHWEDRLAFEGMPAELSSLNGFGKIREIAPERIPTRYKDPDLVPYELPTPGQLVKIDGVWRIPFSAVGPDITQAAQDRAGELARILEVEGNTLRLMAEGFSLSEIAKELGLSKANVGRIALRVKHRLMGESLIDPKDDTNE